MPLSCTCIVNALFKNTSQNFNSFPFHSAVHTAYNYIHTYFKANSRAIVDLMPLNCHRSKVEFVVRAHVIFIILKKALGLHVAT